MPIILAIDSGNSFIKWGLYKECAWLKVGQLPFDQVFSLKEQVIDFPPPSFIVVSHVAREITRNQISELISYWPVHSLWIHSNSFQCGVTNGYSRPEQLGSDRWAALIAAWKIKHQASLVINVGTAVTIDVLSDSGEFLGGVILPGIHLMLNSLQKGTQLTGQRIGTYEDFPVNTDDAIHSGIIHSLLGAIDRMYILATRQLKHPNLDCIISGGGASILIPFMKVPVKVVDNLVLKGLVVIAEDFLLNRKDIE